MFTILIVDDEKWTRRRLAESIDWSAIDVKVVGAVGDGEEALYTVKACPPDILLTDIRMPGMDGIRLMKMVKELEYPTKVILLTGYDDFAYTKEAIRCGAFDYIMKPVDDDTLLSCIKNCCSLIEKENAKKQDFNRLQQAARRGYEAHREKIFLSLLQGEYTGNDVIIEDDKVYGMETLFDDAIKAVSHVCMIAVTDNYGKYEDRKSIARFVTENILKEVVSEYGKLETVILPMEEQILLVLSAQEKMDRENIERITESIQKAIVYIKEHFQIDITVFIGSICEEFPDISASYAAAKQMIKHHENTKGSVIFASLQEQVSDKHSKRSIRMVRKAIEYVDAHYAETMSLNDVTDYLELSSPYFCRVFKEEMGVSFITYLQNYRIEKAVELMKKENCHIYEIGAMVGYDNQQYFNKVFKGIKGVSPAVWREQHS